MIKDLCPTCRESVGSTLTLTLTLTLATSLEQGQLASVVLLLMSMGVAYGVFPTVAGDRGDSRETGRTVCVIEFHISSHCDGSHKHDTPTFITSHLHATLASACKPFHIAHIAE